MKHHSFFKYLNWGITAFCVIALSIVFFFSLFKLDELVGFAGTLMRILMPFVYGLLLAYLLNPLFNRLYARCLPFFKKHTKKAGHAESASKFCSIFISIACALLIVGGLLWMVLPEVISSVISLVESNLIPNGIAGAAHWLDNLLKNHPELEKAVDQIYNESAAAFTSWLQTTMLPQMKHLMNGLIGTITFIKNIFIGIIITVYVLAGKELFAAQGKKLLYSVLDAHRANIVLDNLRYTHRVCGGFINGKLLDSLIIGILCFIGMTLMHMPYTMLISVIIGVTNIIPFFGPFIGAIPSILLILIIEPMQALYFALFVLILQQFDGNILGPKILGDSTGLSGFWVMFAILLAGGLFGFVGMVAGVPLFAVLYNIIAGLINHSLRRKGLPDQTAEYYNLQSIDPQTSRLRRPETDPESAMHPEPVPLSGENAVPDPPDRPQ